MEISLTVTTLIFLGVVCLSGGIIIGALFSRLKKNPEDHTPGEEAVQVTPQAEPVPVLSPAPASTEVSAPRPPTLARPGDMEVLRAWRNGNGKIWLEMDEARFEVKEDMFPEQRRKLVNLVLELRPWLDASQVAAPRPMVQPPVQAAPPAPRPSIFSPIPIKTDKPVKQEDKPKINLKSMVEQIDDVLQEKLSTSIYKDREIHLADGPNGTVIVKIDGDEFDGIDAVPDPELKSLIRLAISDWEKGSN